MNAAKHNLFLSEILINYTPVSQKQTIYAVFNTFSLVSISNFKSTVPGHFTTLWESQSTSTPSGQLAQEAAWY
jgi:hypothetical protein